MVPPLGLIIWYNIYYIFVPYPTPTAISYPHMMGIPLAHVYGDSQVIINWAKGSTALSPPELIHWCRETKKLVTSFQDLSFSHIYREHNKTADRLSKKALSFPQGKGCFMEYIENLLVTKDYYQLF